MAERALAFDPERYRPLLAHLSMSREAESALIEITHRIMNSFVDRAFGDDAAQLARIAGDSRASVRDRMAGAGVSSDYSTHKDVGTLAGTFRVSGVGDSKERT